MDIILKYFHGLTDLQKDQFSKLPALYSHWNEQINVISRQDIDNLYEKHILHSLVLKFWT
jgi:16S rRNA (guanine527-N7)-methyltransferase